MAHLTNFSFEFFNEIFTEDASRRLLYHGAKKSKMTKNPIQGGPALNSPTPHTLQRKKRERKKRKKIQYKTLDTKTALKYEQTLSVHRVQVCTVQ